MIGALLLATARLWALLRVQASWSAALGGRWGWIAGGLALALAGLASASGRLPVFEGLGSFFIVALAFELALGTVLGLAVSLPGWALVGAAGQIEHELELRGPASLAPLLICASLAAALGLGLHRPLLATLLASFAEFALATPRAWLPSEELGAWLGTRAATAVTTS